MRACTTCTQPATSVRCKACCERLRTGSRWRRVQAAVLAEETYCWICRKYLDPLIPNGHPRSRTVDHIWALRDGGPPLDRDNLRAAHRNCNTARTNKQRATRSRLRVLSVDATRV